MGKVSVFCCLSGCTPESAQALINDFAFSDPEGSSGAFVIDAVRKIISDDEREGQEDVTVIGAVDENGKLVSDIDGPIDGPKKEVALQIPDALLRVISHCWMGDGWYYGLVAPPDPMAHYLVAYGANIVVQSASLPILSRATRGRMTPQRLWRLAMWYGFSESRDRDVFDGIDYGEVVVGIDRYMRPTPGMDDLLGLETIGDLERIKMEIIHKGKFWIWMRPDRFPLQSTDSGNSPIHTERPSNPSRSTIEHLPFELIYQIVNELPLQSLLSFVSTSRQVRANLLGIESDRNALARSWIVKRAPWYFPDEGSLGAKDTVGWEYLKRCFESGSMRNRKRIWRVAEQLEQMSDVIGI